MKIIDKNIAEQTRGIFPKAEGGSGWRDIPPEKGAAQVLSDEEILELSELVVKIENHYGFPVDIEWAREACPNAEGGRGGRFYIVQSRPITTLSEERINQTKTTAQSIIESFLKLTISDELYPPYPNVVCYISNWNKEIFWREWFKDQTPLQSLIVKNNELQYLYCTNNKFVNITKEIISECFSNPKLYQHKIKTFYNRFRKVKKLYSELTSSSFKCKNSTRCPHFVS